MTIILSKRPGGGGGGSPSGPAGGDLAGTYPNPTVDLTYVENALAADVSVVNANQFYDGPSVTLAVGTWLLVGQILYDGNANPNAATAKLWDGTTVESSTMTNMSPPEIIALSLSGIVVIAAGTPTWKISLASNGGASTILAAASFQGAGNNASRLAAVKIA